MPELFRKCCRRRTSVRPHSKLRPLTPTLPPGEARPSCHPKLLPRWRKVCMFSHLLAKVNGFFTSPPAIILAPPPPSPGATAAVACLMNPVIRGSMPWISHTHHVSSPTPRPRQVRGLRLFTECYSTKPYVVCPRSRKQRFIDGLPAHPKKVCVVPCISSLRPSLAVRSGGPSRPSIRCQQPRAYTQLAHTRVVGVARISQPRPARVAIVGRLACAVCLRSVLPTAGTCVALNLFSRPPR